MKFISCLVFFLLIEIYNAKKRTSQKVIRIPLSTTRKNMNSANARSIILEDTDSIVGHISIGWPFQDFKVLFDTGSSVMWVFSKNYDTCNPYSEILFKKHKLLYNRESSSSYKAVISLHKNPKAEFLTYGVGWVFGLWADDVVTLDGVRILSKFLEITKASKNRVEAGNNGLIGLQYHPTEGNIASIFCDRLQAEHKFSFYLPKVFEQNFDGKGELLFCEENKSKYIEKTMKYINEVKPGTWFLPLDSVSMEDGTAYTSISSDNNVLIDTGANRIFAPAAELEQFLLAFQSYFLGNSLQQRVDCQNVYLFPNMTFTLGGKRFTLTGYEYTVNVQNNCFVLINPRHGKQHWTFGEPFLRKYYTVFDMKNHRIGFAESKG